MNYNQFFKEELNKLKAEGNYRVFADLEKIAGNFPQALNYKEDNVSEVTVWCSNDYLGMSQKKIVIESMITAIQKVGAGSGGTRNISGTNHYHVLLEESYVIFIKKKPLFFLIPDTLLTKPLCRLLEKNFQIVYSFLMKKITPR